MKNEIKIQNKDNDKLFTYQEIVDLQNAFTKPRFSLSDGIVFHSLIDLGIDDSFEEVQSRVQKLYSAVGNEVILDTCKNMLRDMPLLTESL